jgi:hypothetical protein
LLRAWHFRLAAGLGAALAAVPARASFLSGDALDTAADWLALFVIFVVPCVVIVLFWIVHVLPEQIAHKRHHPQRDAIQVLCLLSLVFGGLLWPIAWIWAYSKPVVHKLAYGTDKVVHDEEYPGEAPEHAEGATRLIAPSAAPATEVSLRERLARLEDKLPASELSALKADIDALEAKHVRQGTR